MEILTPKTRTGISFDLLKLLKPYDNANGGICMYFTLCEKQVSQMEISKVEWVFYVLNLLPLTSIITKE